MAEARLAADIVLDESDVLAFLDNRPVFPGHVLVIPRRHYETFAEVPEPMVGRRSQG